jgi:DNA-binding transcriptional LysR family regulator
MIESQLAAFVTVADTGGFAAAARRLHMSQPGVSRAVKSLESELGADLFLRRHDGVELTTFGERALIRCRAILAESNALRQEREDAGRRVQGRLRLGSMPSVSNTLLPRVLAIVQRKQPRLIVTIVDGHDDELVAWLRSGVVDLAVVAGRPRGLEVHELVADRLLAVLPASHPLAERTSVRTRDLAGEPFILTRAGCEGFILAALAAQGVTPDVRHEVTEARSILAMVSENLGVSVMPALATHTPPAGVALRPLRPAVRRELHLAVTPTRAPSPALRAFLSEVPSAHVKLSSSRRPALNTTESGRVDR